jgi:hypothetical protein
VRLLSWPKSHVILTIALVAVVFVGLGSAKLGALTLQSSGSVGVEGKIPTNPPSAAPTISVPANGQTFNNLPITVSGLCTKGLLVEIFKNGVFAGSTQCTSGSYTLQIDLFDGRNDLVARLYDSLNQAGPNSNTVRVIFVSPNATTGPQVLLTTSFAKRGATPGEELTWPLSVSGGTAPFAITVDWGDKSPTDIISRKSPGDFTVNHTYLQSGVFNITIKASDINGNTAFLQLVGVGNGPIQQSTAQSSTNNPQTIRVIVWWPFLITIILIIIAFWAGQKHQLETIRDRLRKGERPFK